MRLLLASASPRRSKLLAQIGLEFEVMPSLSEEKTTKSTPEEIVNELSYNKAAGISARLDKEGEKDFVVIGADTIVALGGRIMGKPADKEDARRMLEALAGNTHQVCTGVTLAYKMGGGAVKFNTFSESTSVTVYPMTKEEIEDYVNSGEPMDKAGAYAVQGRFAAYIEKLEGSYSNVVGLPLGRLYQELKMCK